MSDVDRRSFSRSRSRSRSRSPRRGTTSAKDECGSTYHAPLPTYHALVPNPMEHWLQHNPSYGQATISSVANYDGPGSVKEVNLIVPGEDLMMRDFNCLLRWLSPHVGYDISQDSAATAVSDQGTLTGKFNTGIYFIGGEGGYVVKSIEKLEFLQTKNLVGEFVRAGVARVLTDERMVFPSHIIRMSDPTPFRGKYADRFYMWMRRAPGKTLNELGLANCDREDPRLERYKTEVLKPFEDDNCITHQDFKGDNVLFDPQTGKYTMIDGFFNFRYCLQLLPDRPGVDYDAVENDQELRALSDEIIDEEYDLGIISFDF